MAASNALDYASANFLMRAQREALGQYAVAALAERRAIDSNVRNLARLIAASAVRTDRFLSNFALINGIRLPGKPALLAALQYSNLSSLRGEAFDERFVERIHMDAVIAANTYSTYARSGSDFELVVFSKHQSDVQQNLAQATDRGFALRRSVIFRSPFAIIIHHR